MTTDERILALVDVVMRARVSEAVFMAHMLEGTQDSPEARLAATECRNARASSIALLEAFLVDDLEVVPAEWWRGDS